MNELAAFVMNELGLMKLEAVKNAWGPCGPWLPAASGLGPPLLPPLAASAWPPPLPLLQTLALAAWGQAAGSTARSTARSTAQGTMSCWARTPRRTRCAF